MDEEINSYFEKFDESQEKAIKRRREMCRPENRVQDILYNIVPRIVEEADEGIGWDDYYLKIEIPEFWLKATLLNYRLVHSAAGAPFGWFFGEIDKRMKPYRDEDIRSFDKRYLEIVERLIKEKRKRFLWEPFYDDEMIDKQFKYAYEIMEEKKQERLRQKYTLYR